jgi:MFS family permease
LVKVAVAMLHKLGWWAIGVALECLGVFIGLVCVALLTVGVSLAGGHPALIVLAVIAGLMVLGTALGGPGYLAARFGGGGEVMGLAVGVFAAAFWIGMGAVSMVPAMMDPPAEIDPNSLQEMFWGAIVIQAVILILPPAIGGWWARREAERTRRAQPQSDPEEFVPGAPAGPPG